MQQSAALFSADPCTSPKRYVRTRSPEFTLSPAASRPRDLRSAPTSATTRCLVVRLTQMTVSNLCPVAFPPIDSGIGAMKFPNEAGKGPVGIMSVTELVATSMTARLPDYWLAT